MINIVNDQLKLQNFLNWLETKKDGFIGFDTETTGLKPLESKILLAQFGDKNKQFVLDLYKLQVYNQKIEVTIFETINEYNITCIAHNAKFDYEMVKANYGVEIKKLFCTYTAAGILSMGISTIPLSLEHTLNRFLSIQVDKNIRDTFTGAVWGQNFTDEQLKYAAEDVAYLVELKDELISRLAKKDLLKVALLELNTVKVTGDMELNGALIDVKKWTDLEKLALDEAETIRKELDDLFSPYVVSENLFDEVMINYNSPIQIKPYLSKAVGKKLKSTDEATLAKLNHPIAKKLLQYRQQMKLASTYGTNFLVQHLNKDGRLRSEFRQLGTSTGRYASRNPNLQNIPSDPRYREPFIAPRGYKFISADFSGQELRLLAHLSQEPEMIKALNTNRDLHTYSASLIYNIPYDNFFEHEDDGKIKKNEYGDPIYAPGMKRLRNTTKQISFGLLYGMGPKKLADKINVDITVAKQLIRKYFDTFPKVEHLMNKLVSDFRRNRYAYSPLDGRKMFFDIDWEHGGLVAHGERQAKNFPFQGAGASTTKQALIFIDEKIKENNYDAQILFAVHDEINLTAKADQAEEVASMVEKEMVRAFHQYASSVPMEASVSIGDHWIH